MWGCCESMNNSSGLGVPRTLLDRPRRILAHSLGCMYGVHFLERSPLNKSNFILAIPHQLLPPPCLPAFGLLDVICVSCSSSELLQRWMRSFPLRPLDETDCSPEQLHILVRGRCRTVTASRRRDVEPSRSQLPLRRVFERRENIFSNPSHPRMNSSFLG